MQTLVKNTKLNVPLLQEIASIYVGRQVVVSIVPGVTWRGEAGRHGGKDVIKLGGEQSVDNLAYSFWHEVAHCALHQNANTPDSVTVADLDIATAQAKAKPNSALLELARQRIAREEEQADELAHELARDHWKKCGPLLDYVCRR